MARVLTKTRTVYIGKPGKTRLTKKWAYIDAAWHTIRRRCECEPPEMDRDGNCTFGGYECELHRRMRFKPDYEVGRWGEYIEAPIPPRHGAEYFKRVANRLAAIYMAEDARS